MIRHIVAFQLVAEDAEGRAEAIAGIRSRLEPLASSIAGVVSLELGEDVGTVATHWPLVLVSDHENLPALEAYQAHPEHVAALQWINTVVNGRAVVDYEVN